MIDSTPPVETFEDYRRLLFAIAYRMLGSVSEAEDIVQEAYLRYQATPPGTIRQPKAFLSTVVTRLCLDALKSAKSRRETYFGTWLPEPLVTAAGDPREAPDHRIEEVESISMAFLVLLESLSPVERAVFLLRQVFDYSYPEIAAIIGRREDACRQIFHRAKTALDERRPRFPAEPAEQQRLTAGFLRAVEAGDLTGLTQLLAEDITLWSDGGGKAAAAVRPIHGSRSVARFLLGLASKAPPETSVEMVTANAAPGVLVRVAGRPLSLFVLEIADGRVQAIRVVVNPDKLRHLA